MTDAIPKPAIGKITSGIAPDTLVMKTIDFVYNQLPAWRDDPDRPKEHSENKLNLQLCKSLNTTGAKNNFTMVHFEHEEYQTKRRSIDISACPYEKVTLAKKTYSPYDPIIVSEGKRLPSPSKPREKEYVTGAIKKAAGFSASN